MIARNASQNLFFCCSSLLFFFLFIGCSKSKKEERLKIQNHTPQEIKNYSNQGSGIKKEITINTELTDKAFVDLQNNKAVKKIKYQEYGGGDCYGSYSIFSHPELKQQLISDQYDCGDYGFANKQFFLVNNKIEKLRTYKFEYNGIEESDHYKFEVAENIYYFNGNKALVKSRKKVTKDFSDTLLTEIPFDENILAADSIYKIKNKELEEILNSTLSED